VSLEDFSLPIMALRLGGCNFKKNWKKLQKIKDEKESSLCKSYEG